MTTRNQQPEFILDSPEVHEDAVKEELVHTYEVAKRLLPFLAKRGIPASPKNYRLFFDYLLNTNPALNKALNELLKNDARFHSQLADNVYDHFYSSELLDLQAEAINKATSDFMAISDTVGRSLEEAISHTSHYQKVLTESSSQMASVSSFDQLQPMLEELIAETETALASHSGFSCQMSEVNQIISNLRAELENQSTLARVDELTGLFNRRHLNSEAPQMMRTAMACARPLSVIMFDLDRFKNINDTWGHNFGDKVLVLCAGIIKKAARKNDLAVRMGGEEFLLVCSDLNLAKAAKVAERIRVTIAGTEITIRGNPLQVTISGGAAQYIPGESLTALIDRADKALYQAKNNGRNLIRVAEQTAGNQAPDLSEYPVDC